MKEDKFYLKSINCEISFSYDRNKMLLIIRNGDMNIGINKYIIKVTPLQLKLFIKTKNISILKIKNKEFMLDTEFANYCFYLEDDMEKQLMLFFKGVI